MAKEKLLTTRVIFSVTPAVKKALNDRAHEKRMTTSEFLRTLLVMMGVGEAK